MLLQMKIELIMIIEVAHRHEKDIIYNKHSNEKFTTLETEMIKLKEYTHTHTQTYYAN